jgi:hypothetical protein
MSRKTRQENTRKRLPDARERALASAMQRWISQAGAQNNRMGGQRSPRVSIAAALLCLAAPLHTVAQEATHTVAQEATATAQNAMTIQYGVITHHYATTWSDPSLPAGVARGTPPTPSAAPEIDDARDDDGTEASSAPIPDERPLLEAPAVLYAVDLGDDGMEMILSAKTAFRPGHCIAVERSGTYNNLRAVNVGYCDASARETVSRLQSVNQAAARRCMLARQSQQAELAPPLEPAELAILCDGS